MGQHCGGKLVWMLRDDSSATCKGCKGEFSIFRRRRHCKSCGGIYCQTCVQCRVVLLHLVDRHKRDANSAPHSDGKFDKVCRWCFELSWKIRHDACLRNSSPDGTLEEFID